MIRESPRAFRRGLRLINLLVPVAVLPPALLLGFVLLRQQGQEAAYQQLTLYHLPSEALAREAIADLNGLRARLPGESGSRPVVRDAQLLLGQVLDRIVELQERWGEERFAGLVARIRGDEASFLAAGASRDTADLEDEIADLVVALRQLERLHRLASRDVVEGLRSSGDRASGSVLWIVGFLLLFTSGISVWILLLARRNLARHHELEAVIQESRVRAAENQRIEALGRVAGGVAHDFNNLLTVIIGHAELIRYDPDADEEAQDAANHVLDAARRAASITRQLLAYSRADMSADDAVDVNGTVRGMEALIREMLRPGVSLSIHLGHGLPQVRFDRTHLQQILMNLCTNAADAVSGGGRIRITTRAEAGDAGGKEGPVERHGDGHVVLAVEDDGPGIAPGDRPLIFDPFFTTKPAGQGTGLGLSMVKGYVEQAGGRVVLASAPGEGAVFEVWLPAAVGVPALAPVDLPDPVGEDPEVVGVTEQGALGRALVVEDEPGIRALVEAALSEAGFAVRSAQNGHEGLEILREEEGRFDLVCVDVMMPGLDGPSMLGAAGDLLSGTRVVVMTGYAANERILELVAESGYRILAKPFDRGQLLRAVLEPASGPA